MLDLFDAPLLPGFASTRELVSPAEERALIAEIDAPRWSITFRSPSRKGRAAFAAD